MSSHLPSFFKSSKKQQLQLQQQQLAAQQQQQQQDEALAQAQAKATSPARPTYGHQHTSSTGSASTARSDYWQSSSIRGQETYGGVSGYQPAAHQSGYQGDRALPPLNHPAPAAPGLNGSKSSSQDSSASGTSGPPTHTPPAKHSGGLDSASGSSVSSSLAGLPLQARTLSGILGAPGQSQSPPAHKMNPEQQQQHLAQGKQAGYGCTQPQLSERQQQTAVSELDAVSLGGIPIAEPPQQLGGGYQQYQQQPQQQQQDTRMMSVDMMDVSNLSLNSPQPMHIGKQLHAGQYLSPVPSYGSQEPQRSGSADEERAREKLREAQEQAAQAQAALQYASQQARVATINAVATQAALESVTGTASAPVQEQPAVRKTAGRYALSDFGIERTLGTGSFGRVHLVRSKHNGRFYAVKVLGKEKVVRMKQVEHTNSEREMLVRVRHPFLVNLWGTFHDVNNLYMVMDFVAGGELFSLLRKSQRFPNSVAKFYAAEVALALDYLHGLNIIYRDLKPENLLLGADGHVKVTDFGFAKFVPDITWTLCGTPDYLAPEVVQSKGYNKSVDWYALGVLIFEMLAGYPPFFTEDGNPMKLYEKIIAGKVRYPAYFDPSARELLTHLLTGDLTKRYGNLRGGSADIFTHAWFAEVDWDKLYKREIPAPYVPKIEGDGDASQFDRYQEADVSEYGKTGRGPHDHLFPEF